MNDFDKIIAESKPTLVDFFATWCGPCKMQAPILEQVKNRVGDAANVIKVDIDRNNALAAKYRVQSVPTLILFKNGEPVWRTVGLQQADLLEGKLREHIATKSDEAYKREFGIRMTTSMRPQIDINHRAIRKGSPDDFIGTVYCQRTSCPFDSGTS